METLTFDDLVNYYAETKKQKQRIENLLIFSEYKPELLKKYLLEKYKELQKTLDEPEDKMIYMKFIDFYLFLLHHIYNLSPLKLMKMYNTKDIFSNYCFSKDFLQMEMKLLSKVF
jgi:hypothetical protein